MDARGTGLPRRCLEAGAGNWSSHDDFGCYDATEEQDLMPPLTGRGHRTTLVLLKPESSTLPLSKRVKHELSMINQSNQRH